ncbi:MAG: hypothetical protein LUC23_06435 [Prevotellaceae bacterium]|nr:hypothetical protein [Prevotellaceae bacterium]
MGIVIYTICLIILCVAFGGYAGIVLAIIGGLAVIGVIIDTTAKRRMTCHMKTFNSAMKDAAQTLFKLGVEVPPYPALCRMRDNLQGINLGGVIKNAVSQDMEMSADKTGYLQTVRDTFEDILAGIGTGEGSVTVSGKTVFYENGMKAIVESRGEDAAMYVAVTREIGSLIALKIEGIRSWRDKRGRGSLK